MTGRPVPSPPQLAGMVPIRHVGGGGYADVFLYEQQMPRREVAVKVMRTSSGSAAVQPGQFAAEANLMARVSTHPYIVTIFHADISADGRPFIVMEYYPGQNYLERARRERFTVAEALRLGIQVGSAVETAHRAGILHRDIKPANILTSEFRRPGLTDFGIASAQGPDQSDSSAGVSIPWSPPEAFGDAVLGVEADVYSLAATVYHLLCGRSPFEVGGGDNSPLALIARIERDRVPPIGRSDVPASLERVLGQAMAKDPAHRPRTVADFLRQLQGVEAELQLAVTPLELADANFTVAESSTTTDDDATRVKAITEIRTTPSRSAVAPPAPAPRAAIDAIPAHPSGVPVAAPRERVAGPAVQTTDDTVHRPLRSESTAPVTDGPETGTSPGRTRLVIGGAVVVVLVALAAVVFGLSGDPASPEATVAATQPPLVERPDPVTEVVGTVGADGSIVFTWKFPDSRAETDQFDFELEIDGVAATGRPSGVEYVVDVQWPGTDVCLVVVTKRAGQQPVRSAPGCVTT